MTHQPEISLRFERPGMGKGAPQTLCLWIGSVLWAGMRCSAAVTEWRSFLLFVFDGQEEVKQVDGILTILNFSSKFFFFSNRLSPLEPGARWYLIKSECIYPVIYSLSIFVGALPTVLLFPGAVLPGQVKEHNTSLQGYHWAPFLPSAIFKPRVSFC